MTTLYVLISNKTEITLGFFTSSHNFVCFCVLGVGVWCLTPLSTTFSLIGGRNRSTRKNHRPSASHSQTLSHNVVSSIHLHERNSNSQSTVFGHLAISHKGSRSNYL